MAIEDYIDLDHNGFYYEPETGRLFKIEEVAVVREDSDGKVRSNRKFFHGTQRLCTHIIFFIMTGKWPETGLIDHRNGNPWDNSWSNLREATKAQNAQNRQALRHELEPGVEETPSGSFRVRVQDKHVGTFYSLEEANIAAIAARRVAYGEFAR